MASQSFIVSGSPYMRRNQVAELNARQAYLPQLIANQQRATELERQKELDAEQQRQFRANFRLQRRGQNASQRMQREQLDQQESEQRVGMGLEGIKLGSTVAQTFGRSTGPIGSLFSKSPSGAGGVGGSTTHSPNLISNMSVGSAVGSGLAGFGAGSMFGGKKKSPIKRAAFGAAAGGLLGLLGGGKAGGIGGSLFGGLGGGLSSIF